MPKRYRWAVEAPAPHHMCDVCGREHLENDDWLMASCKICMASVCHTCSYDCPSCGRSVCLECGELNAAISTQPVSVSYNMTDHIDYRVDEKNAADVGDWGLQPPIKAFESKYYKNHTHRRVLAHKLPPLCSARCVVELERDVIYDMARQHDETRRVLMPKWRAAVQVILAVRRMQVLKKKEAYP